MISAEKLRRSWDQRIARAAELGQLWSYATEVLGFYGAITSFQKGLERVLISCEYKLSGNGSSLPEEFDTFLLLPKLQSFLSVVQNAGPPGLAQAARELGEARAERWTEILSQYWTAEDQDFTPEERFMARALLQPVAEYLAQAADFDTSTNYGRSVCPFCGRKPSSGVLRPEGDGAKRSLVCSFCSTEWQYRRVLCPGCGETDLHKLPIYTAEEFVHVRVESCDSCHAFIKTIDLSKNGHADPIVDEIAAIPLTLWAEEKGYRKLQTNLLGM